MSDREIVCTWVKCDQPNQYEYEMRVAISSHPRFKCGSRFDFGFLQVASKEGYVIIVTPGDMASKKNFTEFPKVKILKQQPFKNRDEAAARAYQYNRSRGFALCEVIRVSDGIAERENLNGGGWYLYYENTKRFRGDGLG